MRVGLFFVFFRVAVPAWVFILVGGALFGGVLFVGEPVFGGDEGHRCESLQEAAPPSVSENVRKLLDSQGLRILGPDGKPSVDIWLRKTVPTKEDKKELGINYGFLHDGTLLGAMRFHRKTDDFRGNGFRAAVYTFRYGLQPEDGDHLGVSEARDFILLCPVKLDVKPDPIPTKEVIKLSVKASGRKHPSVLFLMKMFDKPEKLPRFFQEEDWQYWILDFEIHNQDKGKKPVRLGLVLVGLAEEF